MVDFHAIVAMVKTGSFLFLALRSRLTPLSEALLKPASFWLSNHWITHEQLAASPN
jgi:hypothetical protein